MARFSLTRRQLLLGGAAIATGGVMAIKPSDMGAQSHDDYFNSMSDALKRTQQSQPLLIVDRHRLDANIEVIKSHLSNRFDFRIVAKSLPSVEMLGYIMAKAETQKLMVFHQPFLTQIAQKIPQSDVLMGKPLPINAVRKFYQTKPSSAFDDTKQLQWLVDSLDRLKQHESLAAELNQAMQINIELDVGLHRGGVNNDAEFQAMLALIESSNWLSFSGLMGYEPHIGKVPGGVEKNRDQAMTVYQHYIDLAEQQLGSDIRHLTLNGAGSPTYQYYNDGSYPMTELSAGSCLVKPCGFDLDSLQDHVATSFIATPVLKTMGQTQIPGVDGLGSLMSMWNPNWEKTFFVYGGYWKAEPESPKGLTLNPIYGRSSNQEMLNGSSKIHLQKDDWVFLRPTQSEAVFLQFGDILLYDNGAITERWPVLAG